MECPHCKKQITEIEEKNMLRELLKDSKELEELKAIKAAEDYGAVSFFEHKKKEDNPYTGTYVRPEVITEGVNDEEMTGRDKLRCKQERAWFTGWASENSKNERFIKEKKDKERLNSMMHIVDRIEGKMDTILPPPEVKKVWYKRLFSFLRGKK